MGKPARVFGVLVVLAIGYSLGSCGSDTPKTVTKTEIKVVEVPTVKTRIEYRDKVIPYPDSCNTAVEQLSRIHEEDAVQTKAVGEILLALQEMGTAAAFNDIHEVNRLVEIVREEGSKINATVLERNKAMITFKSYLTQCETAIGSNS